MSIQEIMSRQPITLGIDDTLGEAKVIFDKHHIHHILIINDNELAGIITDRDLYKQLSPTLGTAKETHKDTALLQKKIHLVMSRNLITARKTLSLSKAVLLFYDNHISCLPIVDNYLKVVGIITWRDIFKVLALRYRKKETK